MKNHYLAAALMGTMVFAASAGTLDQDIPALLAQHKIASVSFATIEHGKIGIVAAYGMQSAGVPATTQSLYNIASLTKPLTAETVLRAASAGKFTLDEPFAPTWTDPDLAGDPRSKLLTSRIALSHRTGFPNWRDKQGLRFMHDPGTTYGYSGEGFEYVARFAEKRLGQTLDVAGQDLVFGPAGMKSSTYIAQPWFAGRVAVPHDAAGKALKPTMIERANAADLVYTTPRDYAAFMVDVLNDRGLSPAIAAERSRMQTDRHAEACQGKVAAACPREIGFGLGWEIYKFDSGTIMMHTGRDEGVFTLAYLDRTSGDGAVIFTNSADGHKIMLPLLERLHANAEFYKFLSAQ
ncbi:MAG: serine hydrolase domain-containing protein [Pseudomonadota bacterium]